VHQIHDQAAGQRGPASATRPRHGVRHAASWPRWNGTPVSYIRASASSRSPGPACPATALPPTPCSCNCTPWPTTSRTRCAP
jgi:hypothetical protein